MKILIGRVAHISLNTVVRCGGVAVRLKKMRLAANSESMKSGMKTKKMRIQKVRTVVLEKQSDVSVANNLGT